MIGRTWQLWAHRYGSGKLMHVGAHAFVKSHQIGEPIVPVLVEELLGDPFAPAVTHYAWMYAPGHRTYTGDVPAIIQPRIGTDPTRARTILDMCFTYGVDAAVANGDGNVLALRVTEQPAP